MDDVRDALRPAARDVWSTKDIAIDEWRDVVHSLFPGLSIDWLDSEPRCFWAETGAFADAKLSVFANTGIRVEYGRSPAARGDTYDLALLLAGRGHSRHAGHEAAWEAGDFVLYDCTLPFEAAHPTNYRLLMWRLPREALAPMLAAPDRAIGRVIPGSDGAGAVLGTYARALMAEADRCNSTTQHSLLTHLCGLIALVVGPSSEARAARRETHRAARRQQILTYMETHLRDHRLTAERAADDLRMSRRWLHALLEDGEISFAEWITRRRLEECRKRLGDPAQGHLSIAEIAFLSGFNDLSTFNRRFRAQYGMTPRDARHLRTLSRKASC